MREPIRWKVFLSRPYAWCLSLVAVSLVGVLVPATIAWFVPPLPRIHDEFSNLLMADTILQGRLANPTPELWQPMQTFHVIMEPSYASKYPLATGILIALGGGLFGLPIAGIWLASGLCVGSVAWMLAAVTNRRWALLGGLLIALHPAMQISWSQTYFGGWLTAASSALVIGSVLRLRRAVNWLPGWVLGCGLGLLALSRPYEGFVFAVVNAGLLWYFWRRDAIGVRIRKAAQCGGLAAVPVGLALLLTGWQNQQVTGSCFAMPYQIHEQQYGVAPLFVFGSERSPAKLDEGAMPEMIERYHRGWSLDSFQNRIGLPGWLKGVRVAAETMLGFWGWLLVLVPLVSSPYWLRYEAGRLMAIGVWIQVAASAAVCWICPHYLAPVLGWLVVLAVIVLRHASRLSIPGFRYLGIAWLGVQFLLLIGAATDYIQTSRSQAESGGDWAMRRARIVHQLVHSPGQHLVIVQYAASHNVHQEWVYNAADLQSAKIVWARGERAEWRSALEAKFGKERQIWLLCPEQSSDLKRLSDIAFREDSPSDS